MGRQGILILTLAAVAAVSVACGGSPAAQPPASTSPAATPQATAATAAPGGSPTKAAQPYPVLTPAAAAPAATAAPTTAPPTAAATAAPAAPYPVVPVVDGLALMNERCTVCHDTARIQAAKKSRADWESTVAKEKAKGAKLTDAETTLLVDFLAATYK